MKALAFSVVGLANMAVLIVMTRKPGLDGLSAVLVIYPLSGLLSIFASVVVVRCARARDSRGLLRWLGALLVSALPYLWMLGFALLS